MAGVKSRPARLYNQLSSMHTGHSAEYHWLRATAGGPYQPSSDALAQTAGKRSVCNTFASHCMLQLASSANCFAATSGLYPLHNSRTQLTNACYTCILLAPVLLLITHCNLELTEGTNSSMWSTCGTCHKVVGGKRTTL